MAAAAFLAVMAAPIKQATAQTPAPGPFEKFIDELPPLRLDTVDDDISGSMESSKAEMQAAPAAGAARPPTPLRTPCPPDEVVVQCIDNVKERCNGATACTSCNTCTIYMDSKDCALVGDPKDPTEPTPPISYDEARAYCVLIHEKKHTEQDCNEDSPCEKEDEAHEVSEECMDDMADKQCAHAGEGDLECKKIKIGKCQQGGGGAMADCQTKNTDCSCNDEECLNECKKNARECANEGGFPNGDKIADAVCNPGACGYCKPPPAAANCATPTPPPDPRPPQ